MSVFFSGSFIAGKITVKEVPIITTTFLRFLISSIGFIPILFFKRLSFKNYSKKDYLFILVLSFIGIFLYHILFFFGLKYTSTTNSSLIISTNPIIASLTSKAVK